MSRCPKCDDPRAGRDYISRTRYRCTGDRLDYVVQPEGRPLYVTCGAEYVDHDEVARERAEQRQAELAAYLKASAGRALPYCSACSTTVAIRRCASCHVPLCNDDGTCCFKVDRQWRCRSCKDHQDREQHDHAQQRYRALPKPSPRELAELVWGRGPRMADGVTHRLREITNAEVAAAFTIVQGPKAMAWTDGHRGIGGWGVLEPDGTRHAVDATTRDHWGPGDNCTVLDVFDAEPAGGPQDFFPVEQLETALRSAIAYEDKKTWWLEHHGKGEKPSTPRAAAIATAGRRERESAGFGCLGIGLLAVVGGIAVLFGAVFLLGRAGAPMESGHSRGAGIFGFFAAAGIVCGGIPLTGALFDPTSSRPLLPRVLVMCLLAAVTWYLIAACA